MKVSRIWLQKFFDVELPSTEELADGLMFHVFEVEGVEKVGDDDVIDLKVLQRGHDCLSHRGVAKELSAIFTIPLAHDPLTHPPAGGPDLSPKAKPSDLSVSIQRTDLCKRYVAGYIKGVVVKESPQWLQERLQAIGQKSINNIVDATNFVMFNLGQPLHAFDAGKLQNNNGYKIEVKNEGNTLLIVDGTNGTTLGVAGVKGGPESLITQETKDIIIESANFDSISVRKTAQALKLRTEASQRFEQGISPELAGYGMQNVVELIIKLAGGEVAGFVDVYPSPQKSRSILVSTTQVQNLLGNTFGEKEITDAFTRLGFIFTKNREVFSVEIPFERLDLHIPEDLVEEVGRIIGYDHVPATPLLPPQVKPEVNPNFYAAECAREELVAQGYSEVFTSVFTDRGERVVLNKADGIRPYLRDSLLTGLQEALKKNIPNKDLLGLKEIKLFEIGTVWKGGEEKVMLGVISEKEKGTEKLLEPVSAEHYENLPLSQATRYKPFSKYPYIVRDIALWITGGLDAGGLEKQITKIAGPLLQKISLFDEFQKDGRTSFAFRLVFQSFDRTLTEVEVNAIMKKVATSLSSHGFEVR
ncbi:MAG: phenylalanine--tRNA ligase subunit beta [bacterium]|nr:phenylalanine--tRNA ligase subunit beta [bacterium]